MKITMTVKDWLLIEATIGNTVAIAFQDGHTATAPSGHSIREIGWEASRSHPTARQGPVGWPPESEEMTLVLPADSWHFFVDQLCRWGKVEESINASSEGDPESREQALARMLEERVSQR